MEVYNHLECEYIYRTAVKETGEGLNIDPDTSSRTCGQVLEALTEAVGEAIPLAPEEVQGLVDGNAVEPCREFCLTPEGVQLAPGFQESVLQNIVGIVMGQHHASDLPVQRFAV